MIGGLAGAFILVGVTSFLSALLELGAFVLAPPGTKDQMTTWLNSSADIQLLINQYSGRTKKTKSSVIDSLAKELCELPLDASGSVNSCL